MNVSVLLYAPALASPGMTTANDLVEPESAAKSHSPWPVVAGALSIVAAVVLSTYADSATGPVLAGFKDAAVAVLGVSVMDEPVPMVCPVPLTVGSLAATVTL
ncbi:MAG: hypothetical protein ACXVE9_17690 [Solirubrobacteraceae bacterium]